MPRARGSFYWIRDPSKIADDIGPWVELNVYSRAYQRADKMAHDIEKWMQENAPWEDRTGDARASLQTFVDRDGSRAISITLGYAGDIPYSIYLETMQSGRFAILTKAVAYFTPQVSDRMLGNS